MLQYIVPAILGLIGGLAASLIAPWVNWGIEKKRMLLESRREMIRSARTYLAAPTPPRERFRETAIYSRIRPHLSKETIELIESEDVFVQPDGRGAGANNYRTQVLDDLEKLERKWSLS